MKARTLWNAVLSLALLLLAALPQASHAQTKTCGTPNNPTGCPLPPPVTSQWLYRSGNSLTQWYSLGEIMQWTESVYEPNNNRCTPTFLGTTEHGPLNLAFGVQTRDNFDLSYRVSGWLNGSPPCSWTQDAIPFDPVLAERAVYCSSGTPTYQQGPPVIGPYCTQPALATPNDPAALKARGGCTSGTTTKANPCEISNGNKHQAETDYPGVGDALKFVRSYNSLAAYNGGASFPVLKPFSLGWTATYFQYLVPVSSTDSSVTRTAVYAFRPDGRILIFNLYQGVYVPDSDVADQLSAVAGGYKYQTSADTVETYDSNGRLLSVG